MRGSIRFLRRFLGMTAVVLSLITAQNLILQAQTCKDTTLTARDATFSLPTRNGAYSPGLNCAWTIKPPGARQILLRLDELDIFEEDYLEIYGSQDPTRPLARITGLDPAQTLVLQDSVIVIRFVSDTIPAGFLREGGWTITYQSSQRVPIIRTESDRLAFDEIAFGNGSKILNMRITVANLLNNLVITPPAGFTVSASPAGPFVDTLRITVPRDVTASSQLYVQFFPSESGQFAGRITLDGGSVNNFITVSGLAAPSIFWEPSNGPFSGRVQALGTALGNTVLAGTESGVYRSNSNGAVWLQSNTGLTTKNAQNVHRIASWQRSTCILTDAGMFRSQDSGRSWRRMPTSGISPDFEVTTLLAFANNLFAGTSDGVFRFVSDASGWVKASKDLPSDESPYVEALAEHNGRLFVGLYGGDGVYTSIDSGRTWTYSGGEDERKSLPLDEFHSVTHFAGVGNRLYAVVNALDDDEDIEYSEIYYTDNNGGDWFVDEGTGLTDFSTFQFFDMKGVGETLYLATYDGVFRRLNAGASKTPSVGGTLVPAPWQQVNRGITN